MRKKRAKAKRPPRKTEKASLRGKTVLHIITGSIAVYKTPDLVQQLRQKGARVICVMTDAATKFIAPLTLRTVSGENVYHEFFSPETPYDVIHTSLADEADLVLVSPASADFIARLACGFANDLASSILLVTRCPTLIVPAMNDQMYTHPLTQKNINRLRDLGVDFVDPIVGHLICGKEGIGHIAEAPQIVSRICQILRK